MGVKTKYIVVYSKITKGVELKGAIRIATNKRIPITVDGKKDMITKKDLGGYIVIHENDLKTLLKIARFFLSPISVPSGVSIGQNLP